MHGLQAAAAAARDVYRYLFSRASDPPVAVDEALARISPKLPHELRRGTVAAATVEPPAAPAPAVEPAPEDPGTTEERP